MNEKASSRMPELRRAVDRGSSSDSCGGVNGIWTGLGMSWRIQMILSDGLDCTVDLVSL